jgi:hypothetical protein
MDNFEGATEAVSNQFLDDNGESVFELTSNWFFLLGNRENIFLMNTEMISHLADRMDEGIYHPTNIIKSTRRD